jgi:hypothetical protein
MPHQASQLRYIVPAILAAALVAATPIAVAQKTDTLYESPQSGSRIRTTAAKWKFPFDKTYDELTDDEKAMLRSAYENLGADSDPPFPLNGMKKLTTNLRKAAGLMDAHGELFAAARVDETGAVKSVSFYTSPDPEFSKVVAYYFVKEKFKPALCHGDPCVMDFPLHVIFE